jgi:hypothetical protein
MNAKSEFGNIEGVDLAISDFVSCVFLDALTVSHNRNICVVFRIGFDNFLLLFVAGQNSLLQSFFILRMASSFRPILFLNI